MRFLSDFPKGFLLSHTERLQKLEQDEKTNKTEKDEKLLTKIISEQKDTRKCFVCRRKLPLIPLKCYCGFTFCSKHYHYINHNCNFDYQSHEKEKLNEKLIVVKGEKIEKI